MIKNSPAALSLVLGLGLAACDGVASEVPSPYQGVVELDQRVLAFEVGGRITAVEIQRGQAIQRGARVATLDDALVGPTRAARAADLEAAKAQLALLEAGARPDDLAALEAQIRALRANERTLTTLLTRQRRLVAEKAAPDASLDELDGKLKAARAQRQAAEHQRDNARAGARMPELDAAKARIKALEAALALEDTRAAKLTLASPADGTILEVLADPGEIAGPGSPIATLGDRDHPYVDVFVAAKDVAPLDLGQPAEVLVDGLPPLSAHIEHIADRTEFTPRYVFSNQERPHLVVRVRLRLEDPEHHLHPGLPAFARFPALGQHATAARGPQAEVGPDGPPSGSSGAARPHGDTSDTAPTQVPAARVPQADVAPAGTP